MTTGFNIRRNMTTTETVESYGQVSPSWKNLITGETMSWDMRNNMLSYAAPLAMAKAFGGDFSSIPNCIGFIYGDREPDPFGREMTWNDLMADLDEKSDDIQIQTFSSSPSVQTSVEDGKTVNAVTFHAHSTSEAGLNGIEFAAGTTVYQAVLLNKSGDSSDPKYTILARVSLKKNGGRYAVKPEDFEIALDWRVKFL